MSTSSVMDGVLSPHEQTMVLVDVCTKQNSIMQSIVLGLAHREGIRETIERQIAADQRKLCALNKTIAKQHIALTVAKEYKDMVDAKLAASVSSCLRECTLFDTPKEATWRKHIFAHMSPNDTLQLTLVSRAHNDNTKYMTMRKIGPRMLRMFGPYETSTFVCALSCRTLRLQYNDFIASAVLSTAMYSTILKYIEYTISDQTVFCTEDRRDFTCFPNKSGQHRTFVTVRLNGIYLIMSMCAVRNENDNTFSFQFTMNNFLQPMLYIVHSYNDLLQIKFFDHKLPSPI